VLAALNSQDGEAFAKATLLSHLPLLCWKESADHMVCAAASRVFSVCARDSLSLCCGQLSVCLYACMGVYFVPD